MKNQNQHPNGLTVEDDSGKGSMSSSLGVAPAPQEYNPDSLSLDPTFSQPSSLSSVAPAAPHKRWNPFLVFAKRADVVLAILLLLALGGILVNTSTGDNQKSNQLAAGDASGKYETQNVPLNELVVSDKGLSFRSQTVDINGSLTVNGDIVITPSLQPSAPKVGQIYYDQISNQLAYYNGTAFVNVGGQDQSVVNSLGGLTGQVGLAGGLGIVGSQLVNSGVLSLAGATGSIVLGNGLNLTNNILQNTGVLNITAGTPNVTITNNGGGNISVSVAGAGTGTVSSSGGTNGTIPVFTTSQNIEDSVITQSGGNITVSGNLNVTGALTLGTDLSVSNGGTGASSLTANGVIVGNGTGALSSVVAGGAGLCLVSTAGAPTWGACSGGGVTSLNGLTGALTIANASAAGSTITIDDATTVAKGIASFNATNFSVASGAVNTIQNINTAATPTFAGVNTNNITPGAALTVGISAQTALLQGSTTTITSSGVGNDIVLNSADTIELQDNTNITGNLDVSGTLTAGTGNAFQVDASGNVTTTGTVFGNDFDRTAAGALGFGNTNATSISLCNSANCDTITIGTNADADAITIGDSLDTLSINAPTTFGSTAAFNGLATFNTDVDFTLAGTENINVTNTTGSNAVDILSLTLTNDDAGVAVQRGLVLTNANSTSTTEALIALDNADATASSLTDGIIITSSGVNDGIVDAIDVSAANITNGINIGANNIEGTNFDVAGSGAVTLLGGLSPDITTQSNNNLTIQPGGTGMLVLNATGSGADLDINVTDTITLDAATMTFTLSAGTTDFTIAGLDADSNLILSGMGTDANAVLYTTTGGVVTRVAETETGSQCLLSGAGASGVPTWGACAGGSVTWDAIGDPAGNGAIAFGSTTQTMDWATMDGNAFTFNFTNAGAATNVDNGITINNAANGSASTDVLTDTLLLLQQLDTSVGDSKVVGNALKIDSAANAGITDGIEITNTGGAITNAINIADDTGGLITNGIAFSGTLTNGINFSSATTTADIRKDTASFVFDLNNASDSTFSFTNAGAGTSFISNSQGIATGEFFGAGATFQAGSTANVTVVGAGSKAGDRSVSFGAGINNTANDSVAIGYGVNITSASAIAIGSGSDAGSDALAIGDGAVASANSIAIGFGASNSAANQLVIGSSDSTTHHINHVVIGDGVTSTTPNGFTLQGTSGSGTDIAGAAVTIAGGQGTGTGNGGSLNFQIADPGSTGASLNALATVLTLSGVNGAATFQNTTNSATGLRVLDSAGTATVLDVDTSTGRVGINTAAPTADLSFGQGADRTINVLNRASNAAGNSLTIVSGNAGAGASPFDGGHINILAGNGAGTGNSDGGDITIESGDENNAGDAGQVIIKSGLGDQNNFFSVRNSSNLELLIVDTAANNVYLGGTCCTTNAYDLTFSDDEGFGIKKFGVEDSTTADGSDLQIQAAHTTFNGGTGGDLLLKAGNSTGASGIRTGGAVIIDAGDGTTTDGAVTIGTNFANAITIGNNTAGTAINLNAPTMNFTLAAGTTDFTVAGLDADSNVILSGMGTDANAVLYTTTGGVLTRVAETETGSQCLLSGAGVSGVPTWGSCAGGTTPDFDAVYAQSITNTNLNMEIDDNGGLTFDLTSVSGDFAIRDGTTSFATFDDAGGITFAPNGTSDVTFTLDDDSQLILSGTVTNTGSLQDINLILGDDVGADTVSGLNIDVTSVNTGADSDALTGINISNLSGGNGNVTEYGISVGSGWDRAIAANGVVTVGDVTSATAQLHVIGANGGTDQAGTAGIRVVGGNGGVSTGPAMAGGGITLIAGNGGDAGVGTNTDGGAGGDVQITGGNGGTDDGIQFGGRGGNVTLTAGTGGNDDGNGGVVYLRGGSPVGTGSNGSVIVMPVVDGSTVFQVQTAGGSPVATFNTLTNQHGMSIIGQSGQTNTSNFTVSGASYAHTGTQTGSTASITVTDNTSANSSVTSTTNGLVLGTTLTVTGGGSSAGVKTLNALSVTAPTLNSCSGGTNSCVWDGLLVANQATGAAASITQNGLNIAAVGVGAGALNGINIGAITAGAGTETALSIGGGWDNALNVNGTLISLTELAILDNNIELGDLTTQGTATDEFCLTSETGGGALLEWQSCGGGASPFTTTTGVIHKATGTDQLELRFDATALSEYQLKIENTTAATAITGDAAIIDLTGGTGIITDGVDGLYMNLDIGTTGVGSTISGIHIDIDGGGSSHIFSGIQIDSPTDNGSPTTYGINIGADWDRGINLASGVWVVIPTAASGNGATGLSVTAGSSGAGTFQGGGNVITAGTGGTGSGGNGGQGGSNSFTSGNGGTTAVASATGGQGGLANLRAGVGGSSTGTTGDGGLGGQAQVVGGNGGTGTDAGGAGGIVVIQAGNGANGTNTDGNGGNVYLVAGNCGTGCTGATPGQVVVSNVADSALAFNVQNAALTETMFSVDTTSTNAVKVGNSTGTGAATTVFVLDNAAGVDPTTSVGGAMYYDSTNNVFRCRTTSWVNCDTTGGSADLDGVYDNDVDKELLIDSTTGLLFDMTTASGNFMIQDSNATIATFFNTGGITFAPTSGEDFILNLTGDSVLDINPTTFLDSVGAVDIRRTSAMTGTDGGLALDVNVAPNLTLTEPGSGNFSYILQSLNMGSIAVTAGAGTSIIDGLRITGNSDADITTIRGIFVNSTIATAATQNAIEIGSAWDNGIYSQSTITVAVTASSSGVGNNGLIVTAGTGLSGTGGSNGGTNTITGGAGGNATTNTAGNGGGVGIDGGSGGSETGGGAAGDGGLITISGGDGGQSTGGGTAGDGGALNLTGGEGGIIAFGTSGGAGGAVNITAGNGSGSGIATTGAVGGAVTITSGNGGGGTADGDAGDITIQAGSGGSNGSGGDGGSITLNVGAAGSGLQGDVTINAGGLSTAFRVITGSESAIQVNGSSARVQIGAAGGSTYALVLDSAASDPSGVAGAMYFQTGGGFRCHNGTSWSSCSGSTTLQGAYDASSPATITTVDNKTITFAMADTTTDSNFLVDLQCDTSCGTDGRFAIRDDATDVFSISPAGGNALFQTVTDSTSAFVVKDTAGMKILGVDTTTDNTNNLITNPSFETGTSGWAAKGSASIFHDTSIAYNGTASLDVFTSTGTSDGTKYNVTLSNSTKYSLSFYIRLGQTDNELTNFAAGYSSDGLTDDTPCTLNTTIAIERTWTKVNCSFTTPASNSGTPYIYIKQTDNITHSFTIDSVLLQTDTNNQPTYRDANVQINGVVESPLILKGAANTTDAFSVRNRSDAAVFGVSTLDTNMISNPDFEVNTVSWAAVAGSTAIARDTSQAWMGDASLAIATSNTTDTGAKYTTGQNPPTRLAISSTYTISWYAKLSSGSFTDLIAAYARDGLTETNCTGINSQTVSTSGWTRYSCSIATDGTTPASTAYVIIKQDTASGARTFYIDGVQLELGSTLTAYGAGNLFINGVVTTPMTLKNQSNSTDAFLVQTSSSVNLFNIDTLNSKVIIGTAANGFIFDPASGPLYTGTARPTKSITLVPEYPGALMTGDGTSNTGTMTSDFCENGVTATIVDVGSCDSGTMHNYYTWVTTAQADYDIFIRYQVPSDFDGFASSTSIQMYGWRTDNTTTTQVELALFDGATQCGTSTNVATGTATWTETALGGDETACSSIAAGDILTFRIHMEANNKTVRAGELRFDYRAKF